MADQERGQALGETATKSMMAADGDRKFVTALGRGLKVLQAFRVGDGFLGNQEIADRTGLPKPTVTRLSYTLCELGYLIHVPRLGKYRLAPGAITLGYAALANLGIRDVARQFMDEAAEVLAAPVGLGVLFRNSALYVEISRGSATFTVKLEIGSRIPLATTSMGRALLVAMPEAERAAHCARLAERHPADWPAMRAAIETALDDYRDLGFVMSTGEWRSDVNGVGVPLVMADGSGIYAFNCGGPPFLFPEERLRSEMGPIIAALVREVDDALRGHRHLRTRSDWITSARHQLPPAQGSAGMTSKG